MSAMAAAFAESGHEQEKAMKLARRHFLHPAAGAAAVFSVILLPMTGNSAWSQTARTVKCEPVSLRERNSAGKKFDEARDRGAIFDDMGRFRSIETALSCLSGAKATES
jgi:hypothetical protein